MSKSNLVEIKGAVKNCYVTVNTFESERNSFRFPWLSHKSEYRKANLVINFFETNQKFFLVKNIGIDYVAKDYEMLSIKLNRSDSVKIWIRKKELTTNLAAIFQIQADDKIIFDLDAGKYESRGLFLFFLVGIFLSAASSFFLYQININKRYQTNHKTE